MGISHASAHIHSHHIIRGSFMDNTDKCQGSTCCPRCSGKHKQRSDKEYRSLMNRLSRIEGQVRGIKNMLESDAYCTDIMIQVSAVNAALNCFNRELLSEHLRTCVADDIRAGHEDTLDDLLKLLPKLMK